MGAAIPDTSYFRVAPLVSDQVGTTFLLDHRLRNPWGIAYGLNTPMWIMNNGNGMASLLFDTGELFPNALAPRAVVIPAAGPHPPQSTASPTGIVYNRSEDFTVRADAKFGPSRFIIATGEGLILGWSPAVEANRAIVAVDNSGMRAVYKGVAIARSTAGHFVYVANFRDGAIEAYNALFRPAELKYTFRDPGIPEGYAPHNIRRFGNHLFVAYARQDNNQRDFVGGAGRGYISEFDADGQFIRRFASQGTLNAPWAMARAPQSFGRFAGALLVGNCGDGRINAFDFQSGDYMGQLADQQGNPITIKGLRALAFRTTDGARAGRTPEQQTTALFFTAGIDQGRHGLFGRIDHVAQPALTERAAEQRPAIQGEARAPSRATPLVRLSDTRSVVLRARSGQASNGLAKADAKQAAPPSSETPRSVAQAKP